MSALVFFLDITSSRCSIKCGSDEENFEQHRITPTIHQAAIKQPMKSRRRNKKLTNPSTSIFHVYVISHQGIHSIRELKDILVYQRQFASLVSSHTSIYLFIYSPYFHIYCLRIFQQQISSFFCS